MADVVNYVARFYRYLFFVWLFVHRKQWSSIFCYDINGNVSAHFVLFFIVLGVFSREFIVCYVYDFNIK